MNDQPNGGMNTPDFTNTPDPQEAAPEQEPQNASETSPEVPDSTGSVLPEETKFSESAQMPEAAPFGDTTGSFGETAQDSPADPMQEPSNSVYYQETEHADEGAYPRQEEPVANAEENPYAQGGYPYHQNGAYGNKNPYSSVNHPYTQNQNPYSSGYRGPQQNNAGRNAAYPYTVNKSNPYNGVQQGEKKKNGGKIFIAVLAVILVVVLGVVISGVVRANRGSLDTHSTTEAPSGTVIDNVDEAVTASTPRAPVDTSSGPKTPTDIYNAILPSSVGILVYSNSTKSLSSEGSGVIYSEDKDGVYTYIVTCAHVIRGAGLNIVVQLYNEKEYTAEVVGYDSRTDIGVVRIKASGLTPLEIGDSSSLQVGDTIYAIGNPGGTEFANTFTNGIVTALDRPVSSSSTGYTMECIQHNAAINPGNSGGALVNVYGQLIGINSMKIVAADYEGMGFAVPSSVFVEIVNDLVVNHYVTNRPKIGISYLKASTEQAYAMFVAIKGLPSGSIIIANVTEDSDFYGKLKQGDLITAFNGKDLNSAADLAAFIEDMKVGDEITLHVVRIKTDYSYDEFNFTGKLVEDKETAPAEEEETTTRSSFEDFFGEYFGDSFGDYFGESDPYGDSDPFGITP